MHRDIPMIMISDDAKKVLKTLRKKLDKNFYDQIQMACRLSNYFFKPWPNFDVFSKTIQVLPPVNRSLYELFLLGKTLRITDVKKIFTKDEINELVMIGLLKHNGESVNTGNLSILSFLGRYFIVSFLGRLFEPIMYEEKKQYINMGFDSYLLAYNLSIPRGSRVLDLCTGSGIQAILASDRAEKVIGIEIDDAVANNANCNVALNNVEDKVEIRIGDLYEPVHGEQFDIICSNPPYLAVPNDVDYFLAGNGGPDGLRIINRILDDLDEHLVKGGTCFITATDLIGNKKSPLLEKKLRKLSEKNKWSTTLLLPHRNPIYYQANNTADWAKLINDVSKDKLLLKWMRIFKDLGVNKSYGHAVCVINKIDSFQFKRINLYKHFSEAPEVEFSVDRKPFSLGRKLLQRP